MKKIDLLQLVIIITGVFLAYSGLNFLPDLLSYLIYWIMEGLKGGELLEAFIALFITFGVYLIIAALVLKNSRRLSNYIVHKYDVHDAGVIHSSKHDLLYILFIGLGMYNLLQRLPLLLKNLYLSVSKHGSSDIFKETAPKFADLAPQIISVLLSLFLIIYAKFLADQFSDKTPPGGESDHVESTSHLL